jgi:NAD(P)-dependent dehydrogenase (short-subunit alcohol dehydrogenase family)
LGRFDTKSVVITGAASGIGRAVAQAFAAEGAKVALLDANPEIHEVCSSIQAAGGQATAVEVFLSTEKSCQEAIARSGFDSISVLVNGAGIDLDASIELTTEDALERILSTNLKAAFFLCKHSLSRMRRDGSAAIVNVASAAGLVPIANRPAYIASKGALIALTKSLALDLSPKIRVNCVCPGAIDTPLLHQSVAASAEPQQALAAVIARYPLRQLGTAEDVARAILFLASEESRYTTGIALAVDGGRTMH